MTVRKIFFAVFLVWILLLAASVAVRGGRGFERQPLADQQVLALVGHASFSPDGPVDLAYRDLHTTATSAVPFLLLHGNPVAGRAMLPLARELPDDRRILIPDLPGLGYSGKNITAYSAENQVTLLLEWLQVLGIDQVHVVGYSQGTAVALELVDRAPGLVESVTFIAGVGLQEHELLGSYEWNQPLYRVYYSALWCLRWLIPHFGVFDAPFFSPSTALNYSDTDLRRNRPILETFDAPALILHSVDDRLVPFATAKAHARLVPQAIFKDTPGGHLGLFTNTLQYARPLVEFVAQVEKGTALTRERTQIHGRTDQSALLLSAPDHTRFVQSLILGTLLFLFVFFSEDLSCIAGGILAASGAMSLTASVVACFLGIWVSDVLIYIIGRIFGDRALRLKMFAKATRGDGVERFRHAYAGKGVKIVFLTRFIPGSRVIAYLTAGVLKLGLVRFSFWLALAAALWTPCLVVLAYWAGHPLIDWWERTGLVLLPLIAISVFGIYFGFSLVVKAMTHRGRCALRGRWIRLTQWEFWPAWPVYLPVVVYGCWLAIRYRGARVWAACNPGMHPASGLAMESKSEILAALNDVSGKVAPYICIAPSDTLELRLETLSAFQDTIDLPWPIILKPDVGQRGEGVAVIRNEAQARRYLSANSEPVIAQRYISGAEFGVFYYRMPGDTTGRLFSITEKVLPELSGDGQRTIEELILQDARAVALARHYLHVNEARLEQVPAAGQSIQIVELGTHCRGAIFLDGNHYQSEALRVALDEVLSTYEGFYFGRFDVRVPSGDDLMAGQGFKILELNGVSSESTDIYDPKNSIFTAWRVLCRQWALAFEIGAANRANGTIVPSWSELFAVLRGHRKREPFEAE
jgi:membrane protein DedA with SNARE-associated domain/pimeloyl-ACP methyl ester carboxylesterase